jgi:RNA polymerase sigma-70 factor, ECF subfamily
MAGSYVGMEIAQLVATYYQAVYRYAFRLTGAVPDAEDLTQQAFLVAQEKLAQVRQAENVQSWLFAILRNSFIKGRSRRRPLTAAQLQLNIDSIPAEVPGDDDIDRQRIQEALNELPSGFRLVLVMYYFENASYREISEKLDLPMGTVMSRLARAKGHLRAKLFQPASAR